MALPTLATLPDDVLLELFRVLDTRQLLLARGVCRRWRDLALHPDAWKHRSLDVNTAEDVPFHVAVLSLAPCLHSVFLEDDLLWQTNWAATISTHTQIGLERRNLQRLRQLSLSTCCAVRSLTLRNDEIDESLSRVAKILRNQVALPSSRLRRLRLHITLPDRPQSSYEVDVDMLDLVKSLRGATDLSELWMDFNVRSKLLKWPEVGFLPSEMASSTDVASLKTLEFGSLFGPDPYPFLEFLLTVHADTLQVVKLDVPFGMVMRPVYSLVARCPNLQELRCHLDSGMAELGQIHSLVKLSVQYLNDDREALQCASNFFRDAIRLTHLAFPSLKTALPFLRELASSRQSALETLKVRFARFATDRHWARFGAALLGLLELRTIWIELDAAPVSLLRVITPLTAPRLRRLRMEFLCPCGRINLTNCSGTMVRVSEYMLELRATLRRNPSLHVWGLELAPYECKQSVEGGCEIGCCQFSLGLPNAPLKETFGVFGHEEGQECDLHQDGEVWLRLQ